MSAASAGTPMQRSPSARGDDGVDCQQRTLPEYAELPEVAHVPDPFTSLDGAGVRRRDQWRCRRAEIAALAQKFALGPRPERPSQVSGSLSGTTLTVTAGNGERSIAFDVEIQYPPVGTGPYPALIVLGKWWLEDAALSELGVALLHFPNSELAQQQDASSRGLGKFYELHGSDHPAGALIAWAWGVSRLIDALETLPGSRIDAQRLGITGCSRNGKGALVAGAFDERIDLTLPQEPGAGGGSLWRMADLHHAAWLAAGSPPDQDVQTLAQITRENVWFTPSFSQFGASATRLPFDQHMLMGLVAPRALFMIDNSSMRWLDPEASHAGALLAHDVWRALGVPDAMGASQIGNHPHCRQLPAAQNAEIAAYVKKFLIGGSSADTGVVYSDGGFSLDRTRWAPWLVPVLAPISGGEGG